MKRTLVLMATALLASCAAQEEQPAEDASDRGESQAMYDFIDVRGLKPRDSIRVASSDSYHIIDDRFLLYKGRHGEYLVEFRRRCYEIRDNTRIVPDVRREAKIRARFDTIRGCRIERIFTLTDADVEELLNMGEAPGDRN